MTRPAAAVVGTCLLLFAAGVLPGVRAAAMLQFVDVTAAAGLRFTHHTGAFGAKYLPEALGAGAAFFDVDGDGWQDLLLVNGTDWPQRQGPRRTPAQLYRNDGRGGFVDVDGGLGPRRRHLRHGRARRPTTTTTAGRTC